MTGGAGSDTFRFSANFGHDTIMDFKHSENDHIDLTAFAALVDSSNVASWISDHATQNGADTLITINGHDSLTLHNVAANSLSASDFIVHPYSV
jgi:Ca2+-binding RTX toxin-like protein